MNISQLPPQPDRHTGEPRPPSAPLEPGNTDGTMHRRAPAKPIEPPEGEGPMLEWFRADRSSRVIAGLVVSVLGLLVYVVKDWINGYSGLSWVDTWWLWLLLLPWPFIYLFLGKNPLGAGADWFGDRKIFVKTYELVKVKVGVTGGAAHELQIADAHGGSARCRIGELQQNPRLWDLVYNGLLHSVHVNGAETNKRARTYLLLDYPPTVTS